MASRHKVLVLTAACLVASLGCGARTDTLLDGIGGGASFAGDGVGGQAQGGSFPSAGSPGRGGNGAGGSFAAGGFSVGGSGVAGGNSGGNFGVAGGAVAGGFGTGGGFSTGGAAFGGSFGTAGFGAVGGIAEAGAGGSGPIVDICVSLAQNACQKCQCQSCASQIDTCAADVGCAIILACVQRTQCQLADCLRPATCGTIINQFGGLTGAPLNEVFALGSCAVTTRASCACN
jgi:hypothetical protein